MRFKTLYILLFTLLGLSSSFAQKQIEYKADKIKFMKSYKGGAKRLIGNVQFVHDGMTLTCDSSYFLDDNNIEAYSNVVIRKGDSLTITGKNAKYNGNTKLGLIEGDVVCIEKDMTLTTSVLGFDSKNSIASYTTGGKIISKENTLTSQHGYYHSPSKTVSFKYDVRLVNPNYVMTADTLKYLTAAKIAIFMGPTNIKSKTDNLYCEEGWYNTNAQISHLTKNAVIYYGSNILHADSVHYDKKLETGLAYSNVKIIDNVQKMILNGERSFSDQKKGITWITGNPFLEKFNGKDTLYAAADTIWGYRKKLLIKKDSIQFLRDSIIISKDSLKRDSLNFRDSVVVRAYNHVKIFKRDMQAVADTMYYSSEDSVLTLNYLPVLWFNQSQLSGKKIWIHFAGGSINNIHIPENVFMVDKADSSHFTQLKGKELWAYFKNDTLRKIDITGNVQGVYYMKNNKGKLQGANTIESSTVKLLSDGKQIDKVLFNKSPKGKIIPMKDVVAKELELKGFSWQIERRPKSKEDLMGGMRGVVRGTKEETSPVKEVPKKKKSAPKKATTPKK
jgi:lipopolysaccharide export system protein LptA